MNSLTDTWEEGLSFPGYSLDVAPKEYRLTPEARAAIAEELFSRMSHNDAVRAESLMHRTYLCL